MTLSRPQALATTLGRHRHRHDHMNDHDHSHHQHSMQHPHDTRNHHSPMSPNRTLLKDRTSTRHIRIRTLDHRDDLGSTRVTPSDREAES